MNKRILIAAAAPLLMIGALFSAMAMSTPLASAGQDQSPTPQSISDRKTKPVQQPMGSSYSGSGNDTSSGKDSTCYWHGPNECNGIFGAGGWSGCSGVSPSGTPYNGCRQR
jgi:hypothetical protein